MDFDDRDEAEEEMGLPSYDTAGLGNSSRGKPTAGGGGTPDPGTNRKPGGGGRYRECLKNHAVGIGGHAVDGCGEFMAAGEDGSIDALRCAACSCHRNFHRKDPDGGVADPLPPATAGTLHHSPFSPYYRTPAGYLHHHQQHHWPPMQPHHRPAPLALPSTSGGLHGRDEPDELSNPMGIGFGGVGPSSSSGKKRFRTKFSQEQKEKMLAFAERVGWRIQKHDEEAVQRFCNETSVKRHVLKVWMHNNKHSFGKNITSILDVIMVDAPALKPSYSKPPT